MKNRKLLIVIPIALIAVVCICILILQTGGMARYLPSPLLDLVTVESSPTLIANIFMGALRDGNFNQAYDLYSSESRAKIGGSDKFATLVRANSAQPLDWRIDSSGLVPGSPNAIISGKAILSNKREISFGMFLTKVGANWKVTHYLLGPGLTIPEIP